MGSMRAGNTIQPWEEGNPAVSVATRVDPEDGLLSETSQTQKDKRCVNSPMSGVEKSNSQKQRGAWRSPAAGGTRASPNAATSQLGRAAFTSRTARS